MHHLAEAVRDYARLLHPAAGDVAVHLAHADGMTVTSVIAAPDVPTNVVLDAAHAVPQLRFDRPYAVVATASTDRPSPWNGLPVFSAWVVSRPPVPAPTRSYG